VNRLKYYIYKLPNVRGINDVRQSEMHITNPLVPERSSLEVETVY